MPNFIPSVQHVTPAGRKTSKSAYEKLNLIPARFALRALLPIKTPKRFWLARRVKSEPHQSWYGDRGPRARSDTSKTVGAPTYSFAARRR